jgi:TetR/AcrR family transcriptional regulator, transcriptional repressor for nem operon
VLDAVTSEFHARGYHATALSDLLAATGLHKSSLYGAFGDKHRLFITVLSRYIDRRVGLARADVGSPGSPLAGLRAYLMRNAAEAVRGRGCLSANSALELLPGDEDVERLVARHQRLTKDVIRSALDRAEAAGEIPAGRSTDSLARYLFASTEGLWELGRTTDDVQALRDIVDVTIRALG